MTWSEIQIAFYGFSAGLLVASGVWVLAWWRRRSQRKELAQLRRHLNTQMEITAEGAHKLKEELELLRRENENLRVTVKSWQQKPGREEIRMLQVYHHAVRKISAGTPGFSMAWEASLKEAENEVAKTDRGLLAFAKRWVLPSGGSSRES